MFRVQGSGLKTCEHATIFNFLTSRQRCQLVLED